MILALRALCWAVLAAGLALGGLFWSHDDGPPAMAPAAERADRLLIEKAARRLTVYRGDTVLMRMRIRLGVPEGDKRQQGDGRTPEGHFHIDRRNPASAFHLSLGLDYPRPEDVARARAEGVDPGGDIFIHGQPNGWGRWITLPWNWTAGCIAVSDRDIRKLWRIVPVGTAVEVRP